MEYRYHRDEPGNNNCKQKLSFFAKQTLNGRAVGKHMIPVNELVHKNWFDRCTLLIMI